MSGTSLDGIDVAIAEFTTNREGIQFKPILHQTIPYSEAIRAEILRCIEKKYL
ncbi:MAG: anhydro-N-acetylmuramic acid kinase [Ignavibacteria bacterium]|nr:anhydro-N-acetylmuramic acid kinase [Ignavibacteria bacterium]